MDTPLQFLRDLLPFSRAPEQDKGVGELRQWLEEVAGKAPAEAMRALSAQIVPAIGQLANLHMRSRLLEEARQEAERILPDIERLIDEAVLPLANETATLALAADNLLKGLATAYAAVAGSIPAQRVDPGFGRLQEGAIRRAMQFIFQRQQLAYRAYAAPSASSWLMLHDLYRLAREQKLNTRNGSEPPIEYLYAGALLLAYVDPNKFPRSDLGHIRGCTEQLAPLALIGEATPEIRNSRSSAGQFLVNVSEGSPGRPLLRTPAGTPLAGNLVADFRPAVAVLDRHLRRTPGEVLELTLNAPETILRTLRTAIGGQAARRFSRTRFKPRADLVTGLDQVMEFLKGRALSRRYNDPHHDPRKWPLAISEWALIDESPEGFGLRYVKGDRYRVEAGDIVGLQPRENSKFHICIVRRIASHQGRLELGIQELSPQGLVIELPAGDDGKSCEVLLLPQMPGFGRAAGILAPAGRLRLGHRINFRDPSHTVRLRVDKLVEGNDHLDFFTLERLAG